MKQLMFLVVVLCAMSFAQTTHANSPGNLHYVVYTGSAVDTLDKGSAWGDTIYTLAPTAANSYKTFRFFVRDSSGNSKIDSLVCEYQTPSGSWIIVGSKNLLTGTVEATMVPGDGLEKAWETVFEYGTAYRLRRINTLYTAHVKTFIQVETVSP